MEKILEFEEAGFMLIFKRLYQCPSLQLGKSYLDNKGGFHPPLIFIQTLAPEFAACKTNK
jgi:hypothetical protein